MFTSLKGKILTVLSTIGTSGSGRFTSAGNMILRLSGAEQEFCFASVGISEAAQGINLASGFKSSGNNST